MVSSQKSPTMSAVLVTAVIGLFDHAEHTSGHTIFHLYYQVGKENQGEFDLHVDVRMSELYKEYFDVPDCLF